MSESSEFDEAELDGFPITTPSDANGGRDSLEMIASEFSERARASDVPSIEEYVRAHPHLAEQIREILPMVATLEGWKIRKESECLKRLLPEEFSPGRLGRYEILRELGRGGMGVVYEAREDGSNRHVALKLLPWRFANAMPRWSERFRREAETIARLRHRNIVPIFDYAESDGYMYYVMQLVEGVDLRWIIDRLKHESAVVYANEIHRLGRQMETPSKSPTAEPSPFRSGRRLTLTSWMGFAKLIVQAAQALDYAHRQGVLHNDIKPGNLMLDATGQLFVADFGIGGDWTEEFETNEPAAGTLRYTAPERLRDEPFDGRSDVYSLGATLYELATRRPMFTVQDRVALATAILEDSPPSVRELQPKMPNQFAAVIHKAIAKNPAERYQSAIEFANDLLRFVHGQVTEASIENRWWNRLKRFLARRSSQSEQT
ncbi:serine/threonine protein kinase [Thalassoroseus pseudoceratinae]|uniref:serine/threonine protein kinase n=1 Tax=Thalassoroseus pseudoceratinae TaxID=2713176 RepID=UPI0014205657|nr:serine/threonine-protein kinase [Thalassoroseus pseudoceratinae]